MRVRTEWCGLCGGKTVRGNCSGEQMSWLFLGLPRLGDFRGKMGESPGSEDNLVTLGFSLRNNTNNNNLLSTTHECEHAAFLCCSIDSLAEGLY